MTLDPRTEFHPVIIRSQLKFNTEMFLKAFSTGGQRSSRVASLCEANGLWFFLRWPKLMERHEWRVGGYVEAMIIGEIELI